MIDVLRQSFARQLTVLREEIARDWRWPSPDAAFAWYISRVTNIALPPDCTVDLTAFPHTTFEQAPALASAGFLFPYWANPMDDKLTAAWMTGLQRLSGRRAFTLDRQSFAYRPYEVLGIAVGASTFRMLSAEIKSFMREVISRLQADTSTSTWARLLAIYAGAKVGIAWSSRLWCDIRELNLCEMAVLRWMMAEPSVTETLKLQDIDQHSLTGLFLEWGLTQGLPHQDVGRSTIIHHSIDAALRLTLGSALTAAWQTGSGPPHVIEVVRRICERFPLYIRQMHKRHAGRPSMAVNDEYDVQDILHSLLILHFEDVRPEEWTPSYAGTNTRMDFLLKAEQVIIEVKMTRRGLDQKRILEELAVDKMRYRTHPDCNALICFVYDPEGRCHNPIALERDASEVTNTGFQVAVIVAPHGL